MADLQTPTACPAGDSGSSDPISAHVPVAENPTDVTAPPAPSSGRTAEPASEHVVQDRSVAYTGPLSRYDICARLMMPPEDAIPEGSEDRANFETVAEILTKGAFALKFGRSGKPQTRFVRVGDELSSIMWLSKRKRLADSTSTFTPFRAWVRKERERERE